MIDWQTSTGAKEASCPLSCGGYRDCDSTHVGGMNHRAHNRNLRAELTPTADRNEFCKFNTVGVYSALEIICCAHAEVHIFGYSYKI